MPKASQHSAGHEPTELSKLMSVVEREALQGEISHRAKEIKQSNVEACGAHSIDQVKDMSRCLQDFESGHTTGTRDVSIRIVQ